MFAKINKALRVVILLTGAAVLIVKLTEQDEDRTSYDPEQGETDAFQGEEFDDIW